MMRTFLLILSFGAFGHSSWALSDTGLNDGDMIRFGGVTVTTWENWPTGGGINLCVVGLKNPPHTARTGRIPRSSGCEGWDYAKVVQTFPASDVSRTTISSSTGVFAARNESFSKVFSATLVNEAFKRAVNECSACKKFYLLAELSGVWGDFDWLPIQNYKGLHTLNQQASRGVVEDNSNKVLGWETVSSFLEYEAR